MRDDYSDMLHMPHHVSLRHTPMAVMNRAAQFAPFAALTGYEEAVRETARYTDEETELDESRLELLNEKLVLLKMRQKEHPVVSVRYFLADERKPGGAYVSATGGVKRIDDIQRVLMLDDGTTIPIDRITEISGELFISHDSCIY